MLPRCPQRAQRNLLATNLILHAPLRKSHRQPNRWQHRRWSIASLLQRPRPQAQPHRRGAEEVAGRVRRGRRPTGPGQQLREHRGLRAPRRPSLQRLQPTPAFPRTLQLQDQGPARRLVGGVRRLPRKRRARLGNGGPPSRAQYQPRQRGAQVDARRSVQLEAAIPLLHLAVQDGPMLRVHERAQPSRGSALQVPPGATRLATGPRVRAPKPPHLNLLRDPLRQQAGLDPPQPTQARRGRCVLHVFARQAVHARNDRMLQPADPTSEPKARRPPHVRARRARLLRG
mmetsp:Transcript_4627/g.13654  ORF Transcript_4627/g.13654 Transcript_4627/m.13654 type:complete len:286 (+) Transcript_4627:1851-2708(+)